MSDELVERLREIHPEEFGNAWDFAFACQQAMHEAADALEELMRRCEQALYMPLPAWTLVTERLPGAERKHYWVCTDTGYQCECRWTNNRFGIGESDEWYWNIFDIPQYQKVVAWMPLPEPPKEVDDADGDWRERR